MRFYFSDSKLIGQLANDGCSRKKESREPSALLPLLFWFCCFDKVSINKALARLSLLVQMVDVTGMLVVCLWIRLNSELVFFNWRIDNFQSWHLCAAMTIFNWRNLKNVCIWLSSTVQEVLLKQFDSTVTMPRPFSKKDVFVLHRRMPRKYTLEQLEKQMKVLIKSVWC